MPSSCLMEKETEAEFIFVPKPLVRSYPTFAWIWKRCVCLLHARINVCVGLMDTDTNKTDLRKLREPSVNRSLAGGLAELYGMF